MVWLISGHTSNSAIEADIDEEVKNQGLQAEHDRMLALQQQTNQKLRDLEVARDEARSLLYASLTIKDGRSPELLQKLREAMLTQIREQIQQVVQAPSEAQGKVLEATSVDIADKVASSQAALDNVRRVSNQQLHSVSAPAADEHVVLHSNGMSVCSREGSTPKERNATLVGSLGKITMEKWQSDSSVSEVHPTAHTNNMRKSTWGDRIASLISPSKARKLRSESPKGEARVSAVADALEHFTYQVNMASLSCVVCG